MAKKKISPSDKPRSRKKRSRKPLLSGFFRALMSTPWRQMIMLAIILAVLFWQLPNIEAGMGRLSDLFGLGLVFILAAIITLIVMIWRKRFFSGFRHWNRWLGGAAFILAVWGIIAFFPGSRLFANGPGGSFGREIISYPAPEVIGILRILALVIIGIFLTTPFACFRLVAVIFSWVGKQFEQRPASARPAGREYQPPLQRTSHIKPPVAEKPPMMPEMQKPLVPPEMTAHKPSLPKPERETVIPEVPASPGHEDLRQVAQEVWKKYGQSSDLVTVDGWRLPPIDILDSTLDIEYGEADNMRRAQLIEEALASYGVEAKVVQINAGPTVTQFGVEPGWDRKYKEIKEKDRDGNVNVRLEEVAKTRVKVDRITSLANDLALALAAPSIRIEAPVPGKSIVGIEVPNVVSNMVSLRGVVETSAFQKLLAKNKLALALGKGAGGEAIASDLTKMPHLLIAGATGSGKTVCLNAVVCCLLMHNTPNDVRFIMIDPKRVELTQYNSIPHLAAPVIVDTTKALNSLRWLGQEMDERYQKLARAGARHIEGYNRGKQGKERLPYLVLIIDELADLMMAGFDEVESTLCRLAQLSRAIGIHLVVATQRPSVDVVTGLIKANFPTRISFAVTSQVDSRTILDGGGAEKLLGKGDMLFMPTEAAKPKRLQGCFLSDAEIERLVYFWGGQQQEESGELKIEGITAPILSASVGNYPRDPLLEAARELAQQHEHISTSFLQRKLHIGYPRAARIMEQLEEEGLEENGDTEQA